ncbi:unnamed protein product [Gongylonema pulchrum]|uniref:Eukaryotic translation initiation factor 3 30 kDa subunit n=1 Tax=Gongylonema pulchrum TaxID=637853 RepID=A0A183ESW8_9BILA|nr:unnamed protein product [Gongylonema pulchrum]
MGVDLCEGVATDDFISYTELESLDEFRSFGETVARMLLARANAAHYSEMLSSLLKVAVEQSAQFMCSPFEMAKAKGAAAKPTMKVAQKSKAPPPKAREDLYEDYVSDEYDDYADNFM